MAAAEFVIGTGFTLIELLRNVVFTVVLVICASVIHREGIGGLIRKLVGTARLIPGVEDAIGWALKRQVRDFLRQVDPAAFSPKTKKSAIVIPKKGEPPGNYCIFGRGYLLAGLSIDHRISHAV